MKKVFLAFVMSLAVASSAFAAGFVDGNDGSKYGGPQPCGCSGPPSGGGVSTGPEGDGSGATGGGSGEGGNGR